MKLPNGYGSVTKLSGKRRKPYVVRISNGYTHDLEHDRVIANRVVLGYFKTKKEALDALAEYHAKPYDLANKDMTFKEIYEIVREKKIARLAKHSQQVYDSAYKHCSVIADMRICDIHVEELQYVIDNCNRRSGTKDSIKAVMGKVFEYALQNDLTKNDYSKYIEYEKDEVKIVRSVFTPDEINALWKEKDNYANQIILILLYTGMRANELFELPIENVYLNEKYLDITAAKNKSSIRQVPIHDKIMPLICTLYERGGKTLATNENGLKTQYKAFTEKALPDLNERYSMNHRLHDTRHTFVTNSRICGVDDLCLKKIVGHSVNGVTAKVYTHVSLNELLTEINKVSF